MTYDFPRAGRSSYAIHFAIVPKKGPHRSAGRVDHTTMKSNLPAIAPTATAAAAAEAATATRTTTATGAWLVLCLVDTKLTATHLVTIQALDGAGRIGLAHLDKPEATRTTGFPIGRQRDGLHRPMLREQAAHVRLAGGERQIAYIDLGHKFSTLQTTRSGTRAEVV